jgi:hypothetical protein
MSSRNGFIQSLESRYLLSHGPGIDGIGVLGDSYCDEYQFYSPDRSTARNWVEQLAQDSNVGFGAFSATDPAGPRNAGFEYNWATSAATSTDMIASGQATGCAAQVASGHVDLVNVFIGGNDFRDVYTVLATQGPAAAGAALQLAVSTVATNIVTAVGTVLSPGVLGANPDVHVIITTIPKLSYLPEIRLAVQQVPQIQPFVDAVDGATQFLNGLIASIAASSNRIAVADFSTLIDGVFAAKKFKVGNVEVNRTSIENPTNDPSYLVLADRLHQGTIGQGLLANLIAETSNDAFGTHIKKLSTHDILQNAGLKKSRPNGSSSPGNRLWFSDTTLASHTVAEDMFGGNADDIVTS